MWWCSSGSRTEDAGTGRAYLLHGPGLEDPGPRVVGVTPLSESGWHRVVSRWTVSTAGVARGATTPIRGLMLLAAIAVGRWRVLV